MDQNWHKRRHMVGQYRNNQDNFPLHRFNTTENIAKSYKGDYFSWLTL